MKDSTLGLIGYLSITITLAETFVKKKKIRGELAEEISQLLTSRCTLIDKLQYYWIYRQFS